MCLEYLEVQNLKAKTLVDKQDLGEVQVTGHHVIELEAHAGCIIFMPRLSSKGYGNQWYR